MNEIDEIDENIHFNNFIFLKSDMNYYYKSVNNAFNNRLVRSLHEDICDKFEDEYRKLDIRYKINDMLEIE
jgi:hypothetical protein